MALKRVNIILKDNRTFQGFLLPESNGKIVLKLNSGYNMVLDKKEVKSIKTIEQLTEKKFKLKIIIRISLWRQFRFCIQGEQLLHE